MPNPVFQLKTSRMVHQSLRNQKNKELHALGRALKVDSEDTPDVPSTKEIDKNALYPKLLKATLKNIFHKLNRNNSRLSIDGKFLNDLRFADDIVLLTNSPEKLHQPINKV